jgi:hypothetical protein
VLIIRVLCCGREGGSCLFAKDGEEAVHLGFVEVVLPSEVGGGISVEEHLMKVDGQTAQTRLALFGSDLKVLEGIGIFSVCFVIL